MGEASDNGGRQVLGDGWREKLKLLAQADHRGNSRVGRAMAARFDPLDTARARLEGQQVDDGRQLLHSVEARVPPCAAMWRWSVRRPRALGAAEDKEAMVVTTSRGTGRVPPRPGPTTVSRDEESHAQHCCGSW